MDPSCKSCDCFVAISFSNTFSVYFILFVFSFLISLLGMLSRLFYNARLGDSRAALIRSVVLLHFLKLCTLARRYKNRKKPGSAAWTQEAWSFTSTCLLRSGSAHNKCCCLRSMVPAICGVRDDEQAVMDSTFKRATFALRLTLRLATSFGCVECWRKIWVATPPQRLDDESDLVRATSALTVL